MWTSLLGPIVEIVYPYSAYPSGGVALGASGTDGVFACGARTADQLLAQFTTTYSYEFNDENAPPPQADIPGLTFPWAPITAPRFGTFSTRTTFTC